MTVSLWYKMIDTFKHTFWILQVGPINELSKEIQTTWRFGCFATFQYILITPLDRRYCTLSARNLPQFTGDACFSVINISQVTCEILITEKQASPVNCVCVTSNAVEHLICGSNINDRFIANILLQVQTRFWKFGLILRIRNVLWNQNQYTQVSNA